MNPALLLQASQRYSSFMASLIEVEKLALALSERDRATLAAKLIDSLPDRNSDDESGVVRFRTVNSSMLRQVRYDSKNRFLDVIFRTGERYRYKDVPPQEYSELMTAKSLGRYMQSHIIDRYETVKLSN
jgi:KTSC domain